jgi:Arc/MetJ-type ribon-helix-helix transcriptional regulator
MMYRHTMPKSKIAITVEAAVLADLDALVRAGRFPNRSRAFEVAAEAEVGRAHHTRLAKACLNLDPAEERGLADEGLGADTASWPPY